MNAYTSRAVKVGTSMKHSYSGGVIIIEELSWLLGRSD